MLMRAAGTLLRVAMLFLQVVASAGLRVAVATKHAAPRSLLAGSAATRVRGGLSRALHALSTELVGESPHDGLPAGQQPQDEAAFERALALHSTLVGCNCPTLGPRVKEALAVLSDALRLYGPASVLGSFNGGKDAVVIFHLLRAALADHNARLGLRVKPQLIYFHNDREFPVVERFVYDTVEDADAQLFTYEAGIVDGLRTHISAQRAAGEDGVLAFVLGTRLGDPNCKGQKAFAPSSSWMPPFMRVNPILSWDYGLVWQFLRTFELPYCRLYDEGYTSLGTQDDTRPNPALALPSGKGYYPAFLLSDWALERAGRKPKPPKPVVAAGATATGGGGDASASTAGPPSAPASGSRSLGPRRRTEHAQTAGLVVIGDELLKGKVTDTNAPYAIAELRKRGLEVRRIAVVPDTLADIEREVRQQAQALDLVITSGGVGPTHDDVTIRAVALALGRPLERNAQMVEMIKKAYGVREMGEEQLKMAHLPLGVRLRTVPGQASPWPILQAENIFILPGVPAYFSAKLDMILEHFVKQKRQIYTRQLVLNAEEEDIVAQLNAVVASFPDVTFGSYPAVGEEEYKTIVTVEGGSEEEVGDAHRTLANMMRPGAVVRRPSKNLEHMLN